MAGVESRNAGALRWADALRGNLMAIVLRGSFFQILPWIVLSALVLNVFAYIIIASTPVIISDTWYFLDVFLRHALDHTLTLGEFFVKRSGYDHAQPLRKIILLFELRHFDLDFRIEALIGLLCAVFSTLVLRLVVMSGDTRQRNLKSLLWCGVCIALISLNSRTIWTWPLVASGYTTYLLVFLMFYGLWRWLEQGRFWLLAISAVLLDLAADDTALLANFACLASLAWIMLRMSVLRSRAIRGGALLCLILVTVRIIYALLVPTAAPRAHHFFVHAVRILDAFLAGGWHSWILIPLGSSVAYINQLYVLAPVHAKAIQRIIALCLMVAHGWFWWRAWRNVVNVQTFIAIATMLMFYAFCAGLVYARVPEFGNSYLNQPRYVMFYDFGIVALLLMCAGCDWTISPRWSRCRLFPATAVCLFMAWQVPLFSGAWAEAPYISAYNQKLAMQLGELARNPGTVPANCLAELVICGLPPAKRADLLQLLTANKLNVFSTSFQRTTRLYPNDVEASLK